MDNFFTEVTNTKPFAKIGIEGFAGTGKSYTGTQIAIGLHHKLDSKKPVVYFDTERAAKFANKRFTSAGIKLMVKDSQVLPDLIETMNRCRDGFADILMIDSITQVWENYIRDYLNKYKKTSMDIRDWGIVKGLWREEFTKKLVFDPYSIIMCGRAGYEYESEVNERTGKREYFKSGIKMKAEGDTAYEPDILILMERNEEIMGPDKKIFREACVLKDRSTLLDGRYFKNPTYENFAPAIEFCFDSPDYKPQPNEPSSDALFKNEEDKFKVKHEAAILCEEIKGELIKFWPGDTKEEKSLKVRALEFAFDTKSWTAIESMYPDKLKAGLEKLKAYLIDYDKNYRNREGESK